MFSVFLKSAVVLAATSFLMSPAKAVEVYLFKGAGDFSFINSNMHFSRGLEKIAKQMNEEGIHAEVRRFGAVDDALRTIRKRKPKSVAFIGHSMGALASMSLARAMRKEGVRVAYLGVIDIPGPVGVAGDNVEWAENYFSINPVYGRFTNARSHPKAKNIHVGGYIHNRMDDAPKVQNGLLAAVRAVHAAEQNTQPPAQPEILMVSTPSASQPIRTAVVDPWADHRVVTVTGQTQYAPATQTLAAPLDVVQPEVIYTPELNQSAGIDPVTTSSTVSRPKIGVGERVYTQAGAGARSQPVRKKNTRSSYARGNEGR